MLINSICLWYAYEKHQSPWGLERLCCSWGRCCFWPCCQAFSERSPRERVWLRGCWELSGLLFEGFDSNMFLHVWYGPHISPYHQTHPAVCISRYQQNMFRLRMYKTCQHSFKVQPQVGLAKPYRPPPRPTSGQPTFDHLSKGKLLNICPRQSHNLGIPPYPVSCPWTWGWKRQTNKQTNKVANRSQDTPTKNLFQLRQTKATFNGRNPAITSWYDKYIYICKYPIIYRVSYMSDGAGFLPSTVATPTHPHDTDTVSWISCMSIIDSW